MDYHPPRHSDGPTDGGIEWQSLDRRHNHKASTHKVGLKLLQGRGCGLLDITSVLWANTHLGLYMQVGIEAFAAWSDMRPIRGRLGGRDKIESDHQPKPHCSLKSPLNTPQTQISRQQINHFTTEDYWNIIKKILKSICHCAWKFVYKKL